jgi:probable addiction module antidote protein
MEWTEVAFAVEDRRRPWVSGVLRDTGLSRENLYKALGKDGNPSFATALKVARALGVRLHAQVAWAPH